MQSLGVLKHKLHLPTCCLFGGGGAPSSLMSLPGLFFCPTVECFLIAKEGLQLQECNTSGELCKSLGEDNVAKGHVAMHSRYHNMPKRLSFWFANSKQKSVDNYPQSLLATFCNTLQP
eukprot:1140805-Amphidinium_carterae.1